LAYALAKWYFANSTHSVLALPTNGRGLAAIQQAIETLELSERPHCLIPLTADRDSCRALADHVMAMSDPDTTYEPQTRILVVTDIIENAKVLVDLANDGAEVRASYNPASRTYTSSTIDPTNYDSETGDAKVFRLVDGDGTTDVNFVTDGVTIGDKVRIHFGANAGDWKVLRVITGNGGTTSHELELTAIESGQYYKWDTNHSENATPGTTTGTNQNGLVSYTIWRPLTRAQHLDSIKTMGSDYRALQFGYRVTTTWAPLCIDEATPDGRSATVPGYFMNAALGAGCASAPVQQGFTNYPFAGTNRILFSKGHFTNAQLDTLETSGVWVWQSRPGENFFHCRMQYTVNGAVAAETLSRQFHIIRIADKMHRRFWSALIGFTGVYNITPENLAVLRMVLEATIQASMETRAPRVGPEILNGYVVSLTCDKNVPGQVTAITRIFPGEPIDAIDITNQVRRG
jgi:hypothetical protein